MHTSETTITILGAGVSGITSGILLQTLGYRTEILTRARADQSQSSPDPSFASLYPSASVIPHSVNGSGISDLFATSLRIFDVLELGGFPGVSIQKHYEVFEYEVADPPYAAMADGFRRINRDWRRDPDLPRLPSTEVLYGWVFNCYFADWPAYLPSLFEWYERTGGNITLRDIGTEELKRLEGPIVNCTGLGSSKLLEDEHNTVVLNGSLVKVAGLPDIRGRNGTRISYNYNPFPESYSDAEGTPQDVYCYPRNGDCILGGSRLKGTVGADGNWYGVDTGVPTIEISGIAVPAPVIEMNETILSESYGLSLQDYPEREAVTGYRYTRGAEGLRLERIHDAGRCLIHNYGHGGAGVTLSWGCAVQIARWIVEVTTGRPKPILDHPFGKALFNLLETVI